MHSIFNRNTFLVKESVGVFQSGNNYDVFDTDTAEVMLQCREPDLGFFTRWFRFHSAYRPLTPFDVKVCTLRGEQVCRLSRGVSLFSPRIDVFDENDQLIGGFKRKWLLGGGFRVFDASGEPLCQIKGKWTGWDFRFTTDEGRELAHIKKEWAGLGRELFTRNDNYALRINEDVPQNNPIRQLILSAVLCIDMVLKE